MMKMSIDAKQKIYIANLKETSVEMLTYSFSFVV